MRIGNGAVSKGIAEALNSRTDSFKKQLTKVSYVLPSNLTVLEYLDRKGRSPYADWFDSLNPEAAAKIVIAITRMGQGNLSSVKSVGSGVFECKVDFGPGYRIYLGKDGDSIIILLGGGTKKRQQRDINDAVAKWQDYKKRKVPRVQ